MSSSRAGHRRPRLRRLRRRARGAVARARGDEDPREGERKSNAKAGQRRRQRRSLLEEGKLNVSRISSAWIVQRSFPPRASGMRGARRRFHRGSCVRRSDPARPGAKAVASRLGFEAVPAGRQDGRWEARSRMASCRSKIESAVSLDEQRRAARAPVGDGDRKRTRPAAVRGEPRHPESPRSPPLAASKRDQDDRQEDRAVGRTSAERPVTAAGQAARVDVAGALPRQRRTPVIRREKEPFGKQRTSVQTATPWNARRSPAAQAASGPNQIPASAATATQVEAPREPARRKPPGASPGRAGRRRPGRTGSPGPCGGGDGHRRSPAAIASPGDVFERKSSWGARNERMARKLRPDGEPHGQRDEKTTTDRAIAARRGRHARKAS